MTIEARCHCGTTRLVLTRVPSEIFACTCSLCQKRGALWALYDTAEVAKEGYTEPYSWGTNEVCFHHCSKCGCTTHCASPSGRNGRIAVHARLIEGFQETGGVSTSSFSFSGAPVRLGYIEGANDCAKHVPARTLETV